MLFGENGLYFIHRLIFFFTYKNIGRLVCILQAKVTCPTLSSADWVLCPEELASKFTSHTKAIIINSPSNPLGKVSPAYLLPEQEWSD